MSIFTTKLIIVLVSGLFPPAYVGQDRDQQVAYCMSHDRDMLDAKIAGCTALITSGQESDENLAVEFLNRGNAYDDRMDYARSLADYNEAIRRNPQSAPAFFNRGLSFARQQDHIRAIADYDKAIQLNPQYGKAFYNRGLSLRSLGKTAESTADIARACAVDQGFC